jgi:hypothetical protein
MEENPYRSSELSRHPPTSLSLSCPRCGGNPDEGFVIANFGLSGFVSAESIGKPVYASETLVRAGWLSFLPKVATWFKASLCRSCRLLIIDFGEKLSHSDAKRLVQNRAK